MLWAENGHVSDLNDNVTIAHTSNKNITKVTCQWQWGWCNVV